MLETLRTDLRYALRQVARGPGIATLIIVTLAIGIGANTALFTMANAIFTRPLPGVRQSDRLVWITPRHARAGYPTNLAYPDFRDYRALKAIFSEAAAFGNLRLAVRAAGEPEQVRGQIVSGSFFSVLGARMALGRGFLPEEDSIPDTHAVTVLSYRYWQDKLGGDPGVIGSRITINGAPFTVVGVAEERFNGPTHAEPFALWLPIAMVNRAWPLNHNALESRGTWWLEALGRLNPGVSEFQATNAVATVAARIAQEDTATHAGMTARVQPMKSGLRPGDMNDIYPVATLAGIVTVLVLLIACANVSNILLSRALARRREIAVRLSIGASRSRIVRQLLTECAVLALLSTLLGTLVATWATELVASRIPAPIGVAVDQRVLTFAVIAAIATTILFGLVPALHATKGDASQALRTESSGHDARRSRLQSGFVVAQVALSLVLLSTAGLFLSSLRKATNIDVGFDASRRVLAMSFDVGMQGYTYRRAAGFVRDLTARAQTLPGVEEVAVTSTVPMGERNILVTPWIETARPEGGVRATERRDIETFYHAVSPAYFRALDLPLVRGREFADNDDASAPRVAIVSERFARQAWGNADPIGQHVRPSENSAPYTVVGVAKEALLAGTTERAKAALYIPQKQDSTLYELTLLVRARGDAATLARPLREVFRSMDAAMPITGVQTLAQYRWDRLAEGRLGSGMLSIFGAIALLLASVGVYAVIAFSVAQRTREIGVRVALGAVQRQVVGLFVGQGLRLTMYGTVIGLALAMALAKLLASQFFGISPSDIVALGGVSALLGLVSLLACWLPARRAARVDPMRALRSD